MPRASRRSLRVTLSRSPYPQESRPPTPSSQENRTPTPLQDNRPPTPPPQDNHSPIPLPQEVFAYRRPDNFDAAREILRAELFVMTPYTYAFITKSLGLQSSKWQALQVAFITAFKNHPELRQLCGTQFCKRLNEVGLPVGLEVGDRTRPGHGYFMFQAALYARRTFNEKVHRLEVTAIDKTFLKVVEKSVEVVEGVKQEVELCQRIVDAFRPGPAYGETKQSLDVSIKRLDLILAGVNGVTPADLIPTIQAVMLQCDVPVIKDMRDFLNDYLESYE